MNQSPLPAGCHDMKGAASLLGMTEKKLFKTLREMGWLYTGTYKDDPYHNTPRITARLAGWVVTQKKGYAAPYNERVTIFYNRTLITQRGFNELKNRMHQQFTPQEKQNRKQKQKQKTFQQTPQVEKFHRPHNLIPSSQEREKALQEMRKLGVIN